MQNLESKITSGKKPKKLCVEVVEGGIITEKKNEDTILPGLAKEHIRHLPVKKGNYIRKIKSFSLKRHFHSGIHCL